MRRRSRPERARRLWRRLQLMTARSVLLGLFFPPCQGYVACYVYVEKQDQGILRATIAPSMLPMPGTGRLRGQKRIHRVVLWLIFSAAGRCGSRFYLAFACFLWCSMHKDTNFAPFRAIIVGFQNRILIVPSAEHLACHIVVVDILRIVFSHSTPKMLKSADSPWFCDIKAYAFDRLLPSILSSLLVNHSTNLEALLFGKIFARAITPLLSSTSVR